MVATGATGETGCVPPSLLIVDDNPGFRRGVRSLLAAQGFDVVGEACDGHAGMEAAANLDPDVVLLDVDLPDVDGFEVAMRLTGSGCRAKVVLTSSHDSSDFGPMIARSGACGFVPKADLSGRVLAELLR